MKADFLELGDFFNCEGCDFLLSTWKGSASQEPARVEYPLERGLRKEDIQANFEKGPVVNRGEVLFPFAIPGAGQ